MTDEQARRLHDAASQDSLTRRETTGDDRETDDQPELPAEWLALFETGQPAQ